MDTHDEAMRQLRRFQRAKVSQVVVWDAGDGFVGRGYWCQWRKRIVTEVVTPSGVVMH